MVDSFRCTCCLAALGARRPSAGCTMRRLKAVLALCVAAAVRVGETAGPGVVRQDVRSAATAQHSQLKNVLFVIADDLRPQLNRAYQHPWMKTPHLDEFTETALVFQRAYVQQQVCSPSRNSFLTYVVFFHAGICSLIFLTCSLSSGRQR